MASEQKLPVQSPKYVLKERGHIFYLFFSSSLPFCLGHEHWWWATMDHADECNILGMADQDGSNLSSFTTYGAKNSIQVLTDLWTRHMRKNVHITIVIVFYCSVNISTNVVVLRNTHLLAHSSVVHKSECCINWIFYSGSHKGKIKVLARVCSHLEARVLFQSHEAVAELRFLRL